MPRPTTLQAAQREDSGSAVSRRLRREGIIPAVVYGARQRTYPIQVNDKDFADILRRQSSRNFLVNIEIDSIDSGVMAVDENGLIITRLGETLRSWERSTRSSRRPGRPRPRR